MTQLNDLREMRRGVTSEVAEAIAVAVPPVDFAEADALALPPVVLLALELLLALALFSNARPS